MGFGIWMMSTDPIPAPEGYSWIASDSLGPLTELLIAGRSITEWEILQAYQACYAAFHVPDPPDIDPGTLVDQ